MKKIKKAGKYFMTVLLAATLLFTWCEQSTVTVSAASKTTYTIKKITQKKSYKKVSASYLYDSTVKGKQCSGEKNQQITEKRLSERSEKQREFV